MKKPLIVVKSTQLHVPYRAADKAGKLRLHVSPSDGKVGEPVTEFSVNSMATPMRVSPFEVSFAAGEVKLLSFTTSDDVAIAFEWIDQEPKK